MSPLLSELHRQDVWCTYVTTCICAQNPTASCFLCARLRQSAQCTRSCAKTTHTVHACKGGKEQYVLALIFHRFWRKALKTLNVSSTFSPRLSMERTGSRLTRPSQTSRPVSGSVCPQPPLLQYPATPCAAHTRCMFCTPQEHAAISSHSGMYWPGLPRFDTRLHTMAIMCAHLRRCSSFRWNLALNFSHWS